MEPSVIDENFLNQNELDDIKAKVFMLKDYWKGVSDRTENVNSLIVRVLPAGAYSKYFSEKEIANNNKIMFENFSDYYDKIRNKLSLYFNVPMEYSSYLQYPGFHIFVNNNGVNEVKSSYVNFHLDRFPKLDKIITIEKIESVIVPIVLPNTGGHLLWNNSSKRNILSKYPLQIDSDKMFHYTIGMMARWPGELQHSIGSFTLMNSSESRITMQMHVNLQKDRGTIFW